MSASAETWKSRLIGAGCVIVIVTGSFAISGHKSGGNGKPKIHPTGGRPPIASPMASDGASMPSPSASPTIPGTSTPKASAADTVPPTSQGSTAAAPAQSAAPTNASTSTTIPAGSLGAFSYRTTGYEQTSIPGTKRTYPKTTTITDTKQGSCVQSTWKPVSEHVQSQLLCPSGKALKIASYRTTISFFGVSTGENFSCSGDSYLYQPGVAAGHVWKYKCTSPDAVASQQAHVIGYSQMSVGGKSVRVLHVTVNTTLTGSDAGTSTQDYWISTKTPVLVKETGKVEATQQSIHYTEVYSLTLDSLAAKS